MRKPRRITKKTSKKTFTKYAKKTNSRNRPTPIMRGGYRL